MLARYEKSGLFVTANLENLVLLLFRDFSISELFASFEIMNELIVTLY